MKKLLCLCLSFVMLLSLVSCGGLLGDDLLTSDDGDDLAFFTSPNNDGTCTIVKCLTPGAIVEIPDTISGTKVTGIARNAFSGFPQITSITVPEGITSIGNGAFQNCTKLESITLPSGILEIGSDILLGTAYYNNSENWDNGALYVGSYLLNADSTLAGEYQVREGTVCLAAHSFYKCEALTAVVLPSGVTQIGVSCFGKCTALSSVTLPDSLTGIGGQAFTDCTALTEITIPGGVTTTGSYVFSGCKGLTIYCVPEASRGEWNEYWYSGCEESTLVENVTPILPAPEPEGGESGGENGENSESGASGRWEFTFTQKRVDIAGGYANGYVITRAFYRGSGSGLHLDIPDTYDGWNVIGIGANAFKGKTEISSLSIPSSIQNIGENAFAGCSGLTSLSIPSSVSVIEKSAFAGCSGLKNIQFAENEGLRVGANAFANCKALEEFNLNENMTCGTKAFLGASPKNLIIAKKVHIMSCTQNLGLSSCASITYRGTLQEGLAILNSVVANWSEGVVHCTDGDYTYQEVRQAYRNQ